MIWLHHGHTSGELDRAAEEVGCAFQRYRELLHGSPHTVLEPTFQDDWKSPCPSTLLADHE